MDTYDIRKKYACKVCGNVPDEDGCIDHGRGCYTQDSDGGGWSFVKFTAEDEALLAVAEAETMMDRGA